MIETLDDIIEQLADRLGIYGAHGEEDDPHDRCQCRMCWTERLETRIRAAIEVGCKLARPIGSEEPRP